MQVNLSLTPDEVIMLIDGMELLCAGSAPGAATRLLTKLYRSEIAPAARTGCQQVTCWCHVDPQPIGFFCSACGCTVQVAE